MSLTTNFNYLQPTSFKLIIDRKNFPNLEFFCQNVTHPGLIMPAAEMPVRRLQSIPFPGESLTINELSCNILLDENMESYSEMYNWLRRNQVTDMEGQGFMNRGTTRNPPTNADITLSILSSHNNLTNQFRYIDAIPTSLGDIQFESTAAGTEFITFTATFRFSYFELKTVNANTGSIADTFSVTGTTLS
tara:strand:- start:1245 stop:1814 length:570 start_codon:yes stop_codon:yes gene_type:complete